MDTISRENNPSYLPIFGVAVGVIALILAGVALKMNSTVKASILAQDTKLTDIATSVESARTEAANAARIANEASAAGARFAVARDVQAAFGEVANRLGAVQSEILELQKAKAPSPTKAGPKEPAVAGPGEYIVKSGDGGTKIAAANGVSVKDLMAVNPGVEWTKLKVGQKLKLPKK